MFGLSHTERAERREHRLNQRIADTAFRRSNKSLERAVNATGSERARYRDQYHRDNADWQRYRNRAG